MDKYGVETDPEKIKTADKDERCPTCGRELEKDSPVKKCPVHGTEPFEKKK